TGDPMDDDRPLFSTFKPISKDNKASAKPGPDATPVQPQGAEQPRRHQDTDGRVGRGAAKGPCPPGLHQDPRAGSRASSGARPHPKPFSPCLQVPPGSWPSPPDWSPPEGDPRPELVALHARTRLWFEQTQARRLGAEGELPTWFHGFISRRETEQLLRDQPPGCFLVRFSESTVGFVLSYRGRDRCRHFVLDQLPDGRYVILGERSAHAELADLLRHYAVTPVTPYHEFLTVPCRRVRTRPLVSLCSQKSGAPSVPPPLPAKAGSLAAAQGPASGGAAPQGPYARVHKEAVPPEPPAPPQPTDAKYQQLMCFHTYAEPHEGIAPSSYKLEEPIPFYAMGRGSSPSAGPEENIYSEV
ncbi:SH22A protein, partial [Pelecanoides urinatrix]|nr:SH22A protein [Pelecanoides urinatrix]